ncbi:unnamed protein product [Mytilus edulis]|uniref:Uncharacterized protein n=2 Tax=Mytilus edulis TaxID=6550 RepID=A0A8S3RET2_MYTED|nr:unnamed protein product [Mytilus edulis]
MNRACSIGRLDVVEWLVENVDNTLFDVKTALDCAIGEDEEADDDDDDDGDDDYVDDDDDDFDFKIIDLLLQRFKDEDVLSYITNLKKLMRVSCFNFKEDIIQLLIAKVDSSLLGIDTVMNRACSHSRFVVVEWLLEMVDNTLFDVKTALDCAIGGVKDYVF